MKRIHSIGRRMYSQPLILTTAEYAEQVAWLEWRLAWEATWLLVGARYVRLCTASMVLRHEPETLDEQPWRQRYEEESK